MAVGALLLDQRGLGGLVVLAASCLLLMLAGLRLGQGDTAAGLHDRLERALAYARNRERNLGREIALAEQTDAVLAAAGEATALSAV